MISGLLVGLVAGFVLGRLSRKPSARKTRQITVQDVVLKKEK